MRTLAPERVELRLQNIMLATDFSETSQVALRYAFAIARSFGSDLHIVHAVTAFENQGILPYAVPAALETGAALAERDMKTVVDSACREGYTTDVAYETFLEQGQPWPVLSQLCNAKAIDLIILGTHGRGGVAKFVLGSIAEEVIRLAQCPVLTIGPRVPNAGELEFAARTVLCAVDLLPDSEKVCGYAASLAAKTHAKLTLVHAADAVFVPGLKPSPAILCGARIQLSNLLPWETDFGLVPDTVVEFGRPAEVLLHASKSTHADLIVMGARHMDHPWLYSHFGWAIVHEVLVQAECPVITVCQTS